MILKQPLKKKENTMIIENDIRCEIPSNKYVSVRWAGRDDSGNDLWRCRFENGSEKIINNGNLISGTRA